MTGIAVIPGLVNLLLLHLIQVLRIASVRDRFELSLFQSGPTCSLKLSGHVNASKFPPLKILSHEGSKLVSFVKF